MRDLPLLGTPVQLWVLRCRLACPRCGPKLEHLDWLAGARSSGIAALQKFAENLKQRLAGLLAHCRWPLHTSLREGINNKIKVLKRMAYGYRDDDCCCLKIRAAFPGNSS